MAEKGDKGAMSVREAGKKGGDKVRDERGHEFFQAIGRKGGQRVRELIQAGKKTLKEQRRPTSWQEKPRG